MPESSLGRRLPDLIVEAALIFFALILALGAEEWREGRERQELADRALYSVTEEIRANLEELETSGKLNVEKLSASSEALAAMEAGEDVRGVDVGLEVSLLTAAAWESARMSQSVQYMDLAVVRQLAELYEVQDVYERMQLGMVDRIGDVILLAREDRIGAVTQGITRLRLVVGFRDELEAIYRSTLEMLEVEQGS